MLSIILVNYNNTYHTKNCLISLQNQTFRHFEIIIVENNSNENYRINLENFLKSSKLNEDFLKKIKLIYSDKNLGYTGGNNIGIRNSKGDLILLLNSDTLHENSFLESMVGFFEKYKSIHIAQPKICFHPDKDIIWGIGGYINKYSLYLFGARDHLKKDKNLHKKPFRIDYAVGCALFIRREVLKKIGLLDNIFFMYGGEADLCYRATRLGYNIFCNPIPTIYHNTKAELSPSFKNLYFRNRNIWCFKNFPLHIMIWQFILQFLELFGVALNIKKKRERIDYDFFFKSIKGILKGIKLGIRKRLVNKRKILND